MARAYEVLNEAIAAQIREDNEYGSVGVDEANVPGWEFDAELASKLTHEEQESVVAICTMVNELHERLAGLLGESNPLWHFTRKAER
jgi:hypothetical protein